LNKHGADLKTEFRLDTLADITVGYTGGSIKQAVDYVLTKRRLNLITKMPLRMSEFVDPLCHTYYCDENLYKDLKFFIEGGGNKKGKGGKKGKKGKK